MGLQLRLPPCLVLSPSRAEILDLLLSLQPCFYDRYFFIHPLEEGVPMLLAAVAYLYTCTEACWMWSSQSLA